MTSSSSSSLSPPPLPSCAGDSPLSTTASIVGILTFALGLLASYIALQSATRGAPSEIARLVDDLRSTQREINRVAEYIFDDAHQHAVPPPPLVSGVVTEKEKEKEKATGRFNGNGSGSGRAQDHRGLVSGMGEAASGIGSSTSTSTSTSTASRTNSSNYNNNTNNNNNKGSSSSTTTTTAAARLPPPPLAVPPPPPPPKTTTSPMSDLYTETQSLLASCIRLLIEADSMLQSVSSASSRWDPEGWRRRIVFVMNRHEVGEKMRRLGEQKEKLAGVRMGLFMRKSVVQEGVLREVRERLGGLEERVGRMGREREGEGEGGRWGGGGGLGWER